MFHLQKFACISFQYGKLDGGQIVETSIVAFVGKQMGVMEK